MSYLLGEVLRSDLDGWKSLHREKNPTFINHEGQHPGYFSQGELCYSDFEFSSKSCGYASSSIPRSFCPVFDDSSSNLPNNHSEYRLYHNGTRVLIPESDSHLESSLHGTIASATAAIDAALEQNLSSFHSSDYIAEVRKLTNNSIVEDTFKEALNSMSLPGHVFIFTENSGSYLSPPNEESFGHPTLPFWDSFALGNLPSVLPYYGNYPLVDSSWRRLLEQPSSKSFSFPPLSSIWHLYALHSDRLRASYLTGQSNYKISSNLWDFPEYIQLPLRSWESAASMRLNSFLRSRPRFENLLPGFKPLQFSGPNLNRVKSLSGTELFRFATHDPKGRFLLRVRESTPTLLSANGAYHGAVFDMPVTFNPGTILCHSSSRNESSKILSSGFISSRDAHLRPFPSYIDRNKHRNTMVLFDPYIAQLLGVQFRATSNGLIVAGTPDSKLKIPHEAAIASYLFNGDEQPVLLSEKPVFQKLVSLSSTLSRIVSTYGHMY